MSKTIVTVKIDPELVDHKGKEEGLYIRTNEPRFSDLNKIKGEVRSENFTVEGTIYYGSAGGKRHCTVGSFLNEGGENIYGSSIIHFKKVVSEKLTSKRRRCM